MRMLGKLQGPEDLVEIERDLIQASLAAKDAGDERSAAILRDEWRQLTNGRFERGRKIVEEGTLVTRDIGLWRDAVGTMQAHGLKYLTEDRAVFYRGF